MIDLNGNKKKMLIIAAGVLVGVIGISAFLDIMTNNGGRVTIIGAIVGVVAAAVILVLGKVFKKDSLSGADDDATQTEDNRFKRKRRNEFAESQPIAPETAETETKNRFMREPAPAPAPAETISFEQQMPEISFEQPQVQEVQTNGANMSVPPSEQLRKRGFFGRKAQQEEKLPETIPEPLISMDNEPAPVQENETISFEQTDWDNDKRFAAFDNESFEQPVLSFGDPSDNVEPAAEEVQPEFEEPFEEPFEESFEEPYEEATPEQFEEYVQPEQEEQAAEPEQPKEPEVTEAPAPQEPKAPAKKENALLKDITEGMVIASMAPGQTIDSFFDGMNEDDIVYRDCVEVWASGAKNPMIKLLKYVESIDDKKTAGLIGRECEYVNAMIDRMLYFSQLDMIDQALNMKEYNFSVLVKECLKRFSPFFMEKKIGLLWKGLDVNVVTDKRWFIFALTQVIFNSVEFTPQGGKIAISAKKTDDYIDLVIDDSGEGIDNEELPYVFTAGFMGDDAPNPDETRTGMGLFITRTVLQKLGGECMAESTKGKGTRIVMRLPAMKEEQTA